MGSTSGATAATPPARVWACAASSLARSASRAASSANWFGFIDGFSAGSGGLCGQEIRVHDGTAAGEHDAFDDLVAVRKLGRLRLLVPEGGEEGQQVAGVQ